MPTPEPPRPDLTELPADTVRAVLREVAESAVAGRHRRSPFADPVVFVPASPAPVTCAACLECVPLGPLVGVPDDLAGHLHRDVPAFARDGDVVQGAVTPAPLDVVVELIVAAARRDLLDVHVAHLQHKVINLQIALESNRVIGVAVGVLMATQRCTGTVAFDLLKTASQNQNRKLRDIAQEVQYTGAIPGAARTGPACRPGSGPTSRPGATLPELDHQPARNGSTPSTVAG